MFFIDISDISVVLHSIIGELVMGMCNGYSCVIVLEFVKFYTYVGVYLSFSFDLLFFLVYWMFCFL